MNIATTIATTIAATAIATRIATIGLDSGTHNTAGPIEEPALRLLCTQSGYGDPGRCSKRTLRRCCLASSTRGAIRARTPAKSRSRRRPALRASKPGPRAAGRRGLADTREFDLDLAP